MFTDEPIPPADMVRALAGRRRPALGRRQQPA
jgi:hypothetical protein